MDTNKTLNGIDPITLSNIARCAPLVACEHGEFVDALATEAAAETALLVRVIETVKPALRALACRIYRTWRATSGHNGCNPVEEKDYFDERGACLVDAFDRTKDATGNRGTYGGSRLYLLDDGRLAKVRRTGTWSAWQGEWDEEECTLAIIDAATAQKNYHLADIVEGLAVKLNEQIGGEKSKRTKAAKQRAEKVAALVALVK